MPGIQTFTRIEDFLLEVAKGNVPGHSIIHKFGHQESIGTNFETIWEGGGIYTYLASASVLKISSDDVNDDSGGTGAITVEITGLDSNFLDLTETITLDGQTPVNTSNSFIRVFRMIVRSAGSGGENAGTIYAGTGNVVGGVPDNIFAQMDPGANQTLMAMFTIPDNKTGFFLQEYLSVAKAQDITSIVVVRPNGEVFQQKAHMELFQNNYIFPFLASAPTLNERTDLETRAKTSAGTAHVSGGFDLLLIEDL